MCERERERERDTMRANSTHNIRLRQGSSVAILGVVFLQLWLCSGFTRSSSRHRSSSTTISSARSAENRKTVLEQDADAATPLSDEEKQEQATRMIDPTTPTVADF